MGEVPGEEVERAGSGEKGKKEKEISKKSEKGRRESNGRCGLRKGSERIH